MKRIFPANKKFALNFSYERFSCVNNLKTRK